LNELRDSDRQPDFATLAELREDLHRLLDGAASSLEAFYLNGTGGFEHQLKVKSSPGEQTLSKASTATCVALLAAIGRLDEAPWGPERDTLIANILASEWDSAGIGPDNAFAISFLLEALALLGAAGTLDGPGDAIVKAKLDLLVTKVKSDEPQDGDAPGTVALQQDYEPTAFLTFKAVSALKRWARLDDVREEVERWNWNHLYKECVLVASESADADVFEVAYSVLIATSVAKLDQMTPQARSLLHFALDQFFGAQKKDGTWPRSRPLFVYVKLGHAYCYDYELLVPLLSDEQLRPLIFERLEALRRAARALDARKYPLEAPTKDDKAPYGWASGHHGTHASAESWATASAMHFCFALSQLVCEKIRRDTFVYVGTPYPVVGPPAKEPSLPESFLDSPIAPDRPTLKRALADRLLAPLLEVREDLEQGRPLRKKTTEDTKVPTSAILYGPPGTSKTQLAEIIAKALGWPLLALDPSHLTRRGIDAVHSEAGVLFGMLQRCERMVVLLDEFDELVREREGGSEMEARFLTTAMLPKLTALSNERRIVYLIATNHLEQFDAAIRRQGRFDLIVPVMPPCTAEKERKWPVLAAAVAALPEDWRARARGDLADLTFLEAEELADAAELVEALEGVRDAEELAELFSDAASRCTLRQPVDPHSGRPTWKVRIKEQRSRIRGIF
jgi:hypothetical protein